MSDEEIKQLRKAFGITEISLEQEKYYVDYDIDWTALSSPTATKTMTETRPRYKISVDEHFMYLLLDFMKFKKRYDQYDQHYPPIEELHLFFKNRYEKWYTEEILQEKYPELREIMRDYEVTKRMIMDTNKK